MLLASDVGFVDHNYSRNAVNEERLFGDRLKNGMIVLIGSVKYRQSIHKIKMTGLEKLLDWHTPGTRGYLYTTYSLCENHPYYPTREALRYNRWCTVTNLNIMRFDGLEDAVSFVGVYQDDSRFYHFESVSTSWLVKRRKRG